MLSLISALALVAGQPSQAVEDPDFRCMVAMSMVLDQLSKDKQASSDEQAGVMSIFMYYLGRIDVRFPGIEYVEEVYALLEQPGYVETRLPSDLARCGQEAAARGRALEEMGKALQDRAVPDKTEAG